MSKLPLLNNDFMYNAQYILSQPATRRTAAFVRNSSGFTIVELLIVIVIIGILAAIVIVAYNGIQNNANDTSVKSDLASASKLFELYKVDYASGNYPTGTTNLNTMQSDGKYAIKVSSGSYQLTGNNFAYCYVSPAGSAYALVARSKSGKTFYISSLTSGVQELGTWLSSTTTLCPAAGIGVSGSGTGTWGYQAPPTYTGWQSWVAD